MEDIFSFSSCSSTIGRHVGWGLIGRVKLNETRTEISCYNNVLFNGVGILEHRFLHLRRILELFLVFQNLLQLCLHIKEAQITIPVRALKAF